LPAQLATSYDPASVEGPTYRRWMDLGVFDPDPNPGKPPFTIVIPPPNVTGSLHLWHAFQHTLMDALTRRKRSMRKRSRLQARPSPRRRI
jgi:valyl-tRNA synthetase